jgi:hypothetical protein
VLIKTKLEVTLLEVLVKWKLFSFYLYVEESVLLCVH